ETIAVQAIHARVRYVQAVVRLVLEAAAQRGIETALADVHQRVLGAQRPGNVVAGRLGELARRRQTAVRARHHVIGDTDTEGRRQLPRLRRVLDFLLARRQRRIELGQLRLQLRARVLELPTEVRDRERAPDRAAAQLRVV